MIAIFFPRYNSLDLGFEKSQLDSEMTQNPRYESKYQILILILNQGICILTSLFSLNNRIRLDVTIDE